MFEMPRLKSFKFEVTITEGSDEFWDEAMILSHPEKEVEQMLKDCLDGHGMDEVNSKVTFVETLEDDSQITMKF